MTLRMCIKSTVLIDKSRYYLVSIAYGRHVLEQVICHVIIT
jgi:hypothetical protein